MATPARISTPVSTLRHGSSGERGFFETFPRELRDKIYSSLYRETGMNYGSYHHLRITVPLVGLRLISGQFKTEHDEQCSKSDYTKQLMVFDRPNMSDDMKSIRNDSFFDQMLLLSLLATRSTNVTAILSACDCVNILEQTLSSCASRNGLDIAQVMSSRIRDRCVEDTLQIMEAGLMKRAFERRAHCPGNLEFILLHPGCKFIQGGENRALATWTKQDGLVKDEEAVNGCLDRAGARKQRP